jgi:hypothetical protein
MPGMAAPDEPRDRIERIRIQGFRSLADVTLELNGLSVLIGDNGSGKSAVIEALETLRYFAEPGASVPKFFEDHPWSLRSGRGKCALAVDLAGDEQAQTLPLSYEFAVVHNDRGKFGIALEHLQVGPQPGHIASGNAYRAARHGARRRSRNTSSRPALRRLDSRSSCSNGIWSP